MHSLARDKRRVARALRVGLEAAPPPCLEFQLPNIVVVDALAVVEVPVRQDAVAAKYVPGRTAHAVKVTRVVEGSVRPVAIHQGAQHHQSGLTGACCELPCSALSASAKFGFGVRASMRW